MKPVSLETARKLLDFTSGASSSFESIAEGQLEGAVAAYEMLRRNCAAYLADEVGLGKTYVALGVMGLLRHLQPDARVVVLAPRENIQKKWIKELTNFDRNNWRVIDNRVRAIQGGPARQLAMCGSLRDFAHEVSLDADRDFFLRMTSFSLALKDGKARKQYRRELRRFLPWIRGPYLDARSVDGFRDAYGRALNALVPPIDLLIVDEAHNLKHGFRATRISNRNRILGLSLGHPDGGDGIANWYRRKVRRALFLSATPFESDYGAVWRQFDVVGLGGIVLHDAEGDDPRPLAALASDDWDDAEKKDLLRRIMIRRVATLTIDGRPHTKNMYRREWRAGGYASHDQPMRIDDPKQRLIVALTQKKVAEVLLDRRFNNSFQIGMLSSFESFLETLSGRKLRTDSDDPVFEGQQETRPEERVGIDTDGIMRLLRTHRRRFGSPLPHPKQDATVDALTPVFDTGEKALVFVRRVMTVRELGKKLNDRFDEWIQGYMTRALPDLDQEISALFERYRSERQRTATGRGTERSTTVEVSGLPEQEPDSTEDPERLESFFSWFYRGEGPDGVLSGAAFQKNRLSNVSAVLSTLFEDDHVGWLLGRPVDVVGTLAANIGISDDETELRLRRLAWAQFRHRTRRKEGYPRAYVFEAYQIAALELLRAAGGALGDRAALILRERHAAVDLAPEDPPERFPEPRGNLGIRNFITLLVQRPDLRAKLWPDQPDLEFSSRFRRREQRRELLSAMVRLGRAFVDLYLLAIRGIGSFALGAKNDDEESDTARETLATAFLDLLEGQREQPGFTAYRELAEAAGAFDTIIAVNFPDVPSVGLHELARLYGQVLQRQVPVGTMSGQVTPRVVQQFRMPGFPLVLFTTDVLQEGEDLHTFCRRVVHYGISWTPSAMEQRTGRIDRIRSLLQRNLDGVNYRPAGEEWIQVHYPHLADTIEVLQVRRVLNRLNRFLRLIHEIDRRDEPRNGRIEVSREILEQDLDVAQVTEPLRSAFPVTQKWLGAEAASTDVVAVPTDYLESLLDDHWGALVGSLGIHEDPTSSRFARAGAVAIRDGEIVTLLDAHESDPTANGIRRQAFRLELRSLSWGDSTLLRCASPVGEVDLRSDAVVDALYELQREAGIARVCAVPGAPGRDAISIEADMLFDPRTTDRTEIEALLRRVVLDADFIENRLLDGKDATPEEWLRQRSDPDWEEGP